MNRALFLFGYTTNVVCLQILYKALFYVLHMATMWTFDIAGLTNKPESVLMKIVGRSGFLKLLIYYSSHT
jgi:hypothetical protein